MRTAVLTMSTFANKKYTNTSQTINAIMIIDNNIFSFEVANKIIVGSATICNAANGCHFESLIKTPLTNQANGNAHANNIRSLFAAEDTNDGDFRIE